MPYIIAIVLVAIAALVFFSRPNTTATPPDNTNETVVPPTEQAATTESDTMDEDTTPAETETNPVVVESEADVAVAVDPVVPPPPAPPTSVTLSADASYLTPARKEHELDVTLNIENNIVTAANVDYNGGAAQTPQHTAFEANYKSEVVGKNINNISLSRVGGASLTSNAFNEAVAAIRTQL